MTGMTAETSNVGSVTSKQSQWWMTVYYFSMYPRHAGTKVMLFVWEQDWSVFKAPRVVVVVIWLVIFPGSDRLCVLPQ